MSGTFVFLRDKIIIRISAVSAFCFGVAILKDYMQGGKFENHVQADGKIVLITGANTGIGRETATELAKRGAHVYMACRDMKKCEVTRKDIVAATFNKHVYCLECDLSSFKSIKNCTEKFLKTESRLDILINNAGVMRCPKALTKEGIELQFGVNHMGHFLLTNLLLDIMMKSAPSRIVIVSSLAHTRGRINVSDLNSDQSYNEGDAYNQSKLANILFTRELAKQIEGTGVTVNALHPGIVNTELMRHMGIFSSFFARIFVKPLMWPFLKTPRSGAQTTLFVALEPDLEKVTGEYFSDCQKANISEEATDGEMAKWLWLVSKKWTKLYTNAKTIE